MSVAVDFKLLFERFPGLYLILDAGLRVVAVTDKYCQAIRIGRQEIVGRHFSEIFPQDDSRPNADSVAETIVSLERTLKLRRADPMPIQRYDIALPQSEGGGFQERHWSAMNVPVLDDGGQVLWIIHRVHDVTKSVLNANSEKSMQRLAQEQDLVIQRLRAANEELAELDELRRGLLEMSRLNTISTMASALAHDVSQPLTAAKNYLSALRRSRATGSLDEQRMEEMIAKIALQIDRAGEIVQSLRTLMTAGTTVHRPHDVAAVLGEAVKLAGPILGQSKTELTLDIAAGLPAVTMDRIQIQQVIVSLVTNAVQAMEGLERRAIHIAARVEGAMLRVDVADTGAGMPGDVAELLFEPFGATKLLGSGLGLPISRQIIAAHNGTLTVEPNQPGGTVFTFTLPLDAA